MLALLEQEQYINETKVIALAFHVDYWNRLGWSDPFSSPIFSQRQNLYAVSLKKRDVYTPQMVVDGQREFVGSNMTAAREVITEATRKDKAEIKLALRPNDANSVNLEINIEQIPKNADVSSVMLAITEDNLSTNVARGENSGKKLIHFAVVRELRGLGSIAKDQKTFNLTAPVEFNKDWKRENLNAVVFMQENAERKILGVNKISLKK